MAPCNAAIAIVDDDESVRDSLVGLINSFQLRAHSYASALELLDSEMGLASACILADVNMPGMSGLELQSALISSGRDIPMIFISAANQERVRSQALDSGAVAFLSKPFDPRELMGHIDSVLCGQP